MSLNDFVGFSMGKINKMMRNKEIKYSKIGKSVRFDIDDILEMFKNGLVWV